MNSHDIIKLKLHNYDIKLEFPNQELELDRLDLSDAELKLQQTSPSVGDSTKEFYLQTSKV